MSTERQDLSLDLQKAAIAEYAQDNDIEIVATYADEGKSGLHIENRRGMRQLLSDVASPSCGFSRVLVYDISRWGRFQNPDASAYYDYHCRLHGVEVDYVAEAFGPDTSPMMAVIKSLKRVMAAEYSRELSVKCRAGQERVLSLGFEMGNLPCLGYRRQSVGSDGSPKHLLEPGERKGMHSDRVRWVLGPPAEVKLVRRIFSLFANTEISIKDLARLLARESKTTERGDAITVHMLSALIRSAAFVGDFVWGRAGEGGRQIEANRNASWMTGGIPAIVERETWQRAQDKCRLRSGRRVTKDQLLSELRRASSMYPDLTGATLIEHGCSGVHAYINRFGSMKEAIRLAGLDYKVMRAAGTRKAVKARSLRRRFTNDVADLMRQQNVQVTTKSRCGALVINGLVRVGSHLIHCERRARVAAARWYVRRLQVTRPIDAVLVVRMNNDDTAKDFFLVPIQEFRGFPMFLGEPAPERARSFQISTARDLVSRMLSLTPTP